MRFTRSLARGAARTSRYRSSGWSRWSRRRWFASGYRQRRSRWRRSRSSSSGSELAWGRMGVRLGSDPEGSRNKPAAAAEIAIVDEGHRRTMDLGLEIPQSPLETVLSHEVWEEYYDRLAALITGHRTTLIFVNTRRLAERVARHLTDRLGEDAVTAHHGSLSKEKRLHAATPLQDGGLKTLVAAASLQPGIALRHVGLACRIGSPRPIAARL